MKGAVAFGGKLRPKVLTTEHRLVADNTTAYQQEWSGVIENENPRETREREIDR